MTMTSKQQPSGDPTWRVDRVRSQIRGNTSVLTLLASENLPGISQQGKEASAAAYVEWEKNSAELHAWRNAAAEMTRLQGEIAELEPHIPKLDQAVKEAVLSGDQERITEARGNADDYRHSLEYFQSELKDVQAVALEAYDAAAAALQRYREQAARELHQSAVMRRDAIFAEISEVLTPLLVKLNDATRLMVYSESAHNGLTINGDSPATPEVVLGRRPVEEAKEERSPTSPFGVGQGVSIHS